MSSLAALEAKLNLLLSNVEMNDKKINILVQSASKMEQQLFEFLEISTLNRGRISTVENHMGALQQDVKKFNDLINAREQQGRTLAINRNRNNIFFNHHVHIL